MAKDRIDTQMVTGLVRFGFLRIFDPDTTQNGTPEDPIYSVSLLIPKSDNKTIDEINRNIQNALQNGLTSLWNGKKPSSLALPLHDGDEEMSERPEYHGMCYLNAKCHGRYHTPEVLDRYKQKITAEHAEEFYSGCWGLAAINFFPYDNRGKRGVSCGLNSLLKIKDGEHLNGQKTAEQQFAGVDVSQYGADDPDDDLGL